MHIITYYIYILYLSISYIYILYLYPISISISIYLYLSLSISIYIYLYLSISIYLYLSLSISIYLYLSLSISLSIFMAFYLSMVELKNTTMVNPGDLLWTWPYNHCRYIADILQIYCRYIWVTQSPLQFPSHHQPRPSRLFTARHACVQLASFPDGPPRPNDPPRRGPDGPPAGAPRCLANLGVPPQMGIYMAMDQYLLIPFLVGWTSIYQLFWCSPGVQGFDTLPYGFMDGWFMDLWMVYGWFMDGLWDIYPWWKGWFMLFMPSFYPHSCWLLMIWRFPTMGLPPYHLWEKIHCKPSSDKGVPP